MVLIIETGQVLSKEVGIINGVGLSTQTLGQMLIGGRYLLYY
jgi:hypothetical protein